MQPRTVTLADGSAAPAMGLGTWQYGEHAGQRATEVAALRHALAIGYRLFDTAEMYADGGAEQVLGEALGQALRSTSLRRDELFIVSKAYPHNATPAALRRSCEASLKRLGLDHLDLYLLHWRGSTPLAETVAGFEALRAAGLISRWGVSNFDTEDLEELARVRHGTACAANQVYLSLEERGPQSHLLPWQQRHSMALMAYSPLDQGQQQLLRHPALSAVAAAHRATPAQVALASLLALPGVIVIPKSSNPARIEENWNAQTLTLTGQDHAAIDRAFPLPKSKQPLAMR